MLFILKQHIYSRVIQAFIQKIFAKVRSDGILSLSRAAKKNFYEICQVRKFNKDKIKLVEKSKQDPIKFVFESSNGLIQPLQIKSEISQAFEFLCKEKPRFLLEIGTAKGGTLFLHTRACESDAKIISIDLPGGKFGGGYVPWRRGLYKSFARGSQKIELLQANSHDRSTFEKARSLLNGEKLDALFIDGDHTYEGVKRDFEMYSKLVRAGGVVILHDIATSHHPESTVDRFWKEVVKQYPTTHGEWIENSEQGWAGIGWIRV